MSDRIPIAEFVIGKNAMSYVLMIRPPGRGGYIVHGSQYRTIKEVRRKLGVIRKAMKSIELENLFSMSLKNWVAWASQTLADHEKKTGK